MNIVIFSWRGPGHPNAGGAEISTHEHAKGWVAAGHSVTLFTSYFTGAKNNESVDGVEIIRKGFEIFGVQIEAFKWYVFSKHPKYDLIIDEFHGIPFFTPLYVRKKKLGFIHEVAKEVWFLNPWPKPYNLVPAFFGRVSEPLLFILYKNIPFMTVSDSTKKDLMNWGIAEKNIEVIHNGLDKHRNYRLPKKNEKKTLVFLGALAKDKGIEDVLKIFSEINSQVSQYRFWIIGKGEKSYTYFLKAKAKELRLISNIKFWGYVSEEQKHQLLARAHLLINPSIREGWSLVVMEAASVGTPTVGYDVPGLRDSILNKKTGILSKKDPQSLVAEVFDIINDTDKYEFFRKNCIEWAKKFTWEKSVSQSLQLIKKIVD